MRRCGDLSGSDHDGSLRSIVGDLGKTAYYSNAKARERNGWQPRPVADSIADTGESLLAHAGD